MDMITNPFMAPPFAESQAIAWAKGFAFGFQGPPESVPRPSDIDPNDGDAFDAGVLVGQQTAIAGFPVPSECVDLREPPPSLLAFAPAGFEALTFLKEVGKKAGGAVVSAILAFIDFTMAKTLHFHDPTESVAQPAEQLAEMLSNMGITDSMALFLGGGIDENVAGCELKLTPVFRNLEDAHAAAQAMGRPNFIVMSWRTDASRSLTLVDNG
jgi:hypothetical protein